MQLQISHRCEYNTVHESGITENDIILEWVLDLSWGCRVVRFERQTSYQDGYVYSWGNDRAPVLSSPCNIQQSPSLILY